MSERTFPCEHCGTEGRLYTTRSGHPNDPDTIDDGECPVCHGECSVDAKTFIAGFEGDEEDAMLLEAQAIVEAEEREERGRLALLRLQKGDFAVAAINDDVPF